MTTQRLTSSASKRAARSVIRLSVRGPLRAPVLALLRTGVRTFPQYRPVSAFAFYGGEELAAGGTELTGQLLTGSRIRLLPADYMHRHIYFYGEYEHSTTQFFHSVAQRGWTFLDVGANAGYYSLLAHDLGGHGSSIHAFEPNPRLNALLQESILLSSGTIRAVQAACSDRTGTASLHLSTEVGNTGLSTLRSDVLPGSAARIPVPLITLDDYCDDRSLRPDIIKIDVEGHELSVVRGACRLLRAHVPRYVICELAPQRSDAGPLLQVMADNGYSARSLNPSGGLRPFQEDGLQNVVFVRV